MERYLKLLAEIEEVNEQINAVNKKAKEVFDTLTHLDCIRLVYEPKIGQETDSCEITWI